MAFTRLIETSRCPPGRGTFVEKDGHKLAVFHLIDPERFAVIDDLCPHAGGDLSIGELTGQIVTCPWHHWEFDVTTGVCPHKPSAKISAYPVEIRDGYVYADLAAPV
jgi:nitrite reductase/ring-hydroxylating ferredoxin subunit